MPRKPFSFGAFFCFSGLLCSLSGLCPCFFACGKGIQAACKAQQHNGQKVCNIACAGLPKHQKYRQPEQAQRRHKGFCLPHSAPLIIPAAASSMNPI